jgi:hypothetical protein
MFRATLIYLLVSAVAALATPALGGPGVSFVVWSAGAFVLGVVLVRTTNNGVERAPDGSLPTGRVLIAVVVGVIAACLAFVVMVNIWERLGVPH